MIFFSLRTAGGMLVIERLQRRKAAPVAHRVLQTCLDLQRTVGIKRAVRFCQCNGLDVPAVIGWFRPIVLLPMTVLAGLSQAQLEAVIAHELAHIKRWDYFVNLFQIAAETVLFYHPAVWWVSRRIRLERENCCDDMAVELCGNVVDYARALTYMEGGRTAPSLVMAASGSPLAARVLRLLGARKSGGNVLGTGLAIGVVCLAGGILISQAFVRVAHADLRARPGHDIAGQDQRLTKSHYRFLLSQAGHRTRGSADGSSGTARATGSARCRLAHTSSPTHSANPSNYQRPSSWPRLVYRKPEGGGPGQPLG